MFILFIPSNEYQGHDCQWLLQPSLIFKLEKNNIKKHNDHFK